MLRRWFRVTRCVTQTALVFARATRSWRLCDGSEAAQGNTATDGQGKIRSGRYLNQGRSKATIVVPIAETRARPPCGLIARPTTGTAKVIPPAETGTQRTPRTRPRGRHSERYSSTKHDNRCSPSRTQLCPIDVYHSDVRVTGGTHVGSRSGYLLRLRGEICLWG